MNLNTCISSIIVGLLVFSSVVLHVTAKCDSCDLKEYLSELKEEVITLECLASKMNLSLSVLSKSDVPLDISIKRAKQYEKISRAILNLESEIELISNSIMKLRSETVQGAVGSESILVDVRMPDGHAAKTCKEYYNYDPTLENGVYFIKPFDDEPEFRVFCDMKNGGYILFQRRIDGDVDFYRNWSNYTQGFGDERTSYWLGLKKMSKFTQKYTSSLRVELYYGATNEILYEEYNNFSIDTEDNLFVLSLGSSSGTLGDSLSFHSGSKFSTYDNDNDTWNGNSAENFHGAYWYPAGHWSNLNGAYLKGSNPVRTDGMNWYTHSHHDYSYEKSSMGMIEQ